MKNKNNFNLVLIIGVFIINIIIFGCAGAKNNDQVSTVSTEKKLTDSSNIIETESDNTNMTTASKTPKVKVKFSTPGVTMKNFNKLEMDMEYEEVVKILGKEGKVGVQSQLEPCVYVEYEWGGKTPLTFIRALFKCHKMIRKSQMGLK